MEVDGELSLHEILESGSSSEKECDSNCDTEKNGHVVILGSFHFISTAKMREIGFLGFDYEAALRSAFFA